MTKENDPDVWVFNVNDPKLGIPRMLARGITARVFSGEHAMLSVVKLEPNSVGEIHSHAEEQWGVLLEGECVRLQRGKATKMKVGDFWHTPSGVPHGIQTDSIGALVLDIFSPPRQEYKREGIGFGMGHIDRK
jgi:quercetin dioxygenase-like cupin family protein